MELSSKEVGFEDPMSGAFCKLTESEKPDEDLCHYDIIVKFPDSNETIIPLGYVSWNKAWHEYRKQLNKVLDSIEKWDDL